jgi:putative copper resistance protein D
VLLVLADFLTGLLRGLTHGTLALAAGGLVWGLVVLRAPRPVASVAAVRRCLVLVQVGAVALAISQGLALGLEASVLSASLGRSPLIDLLATPHYLAGLTRVALAIVLAVIAQRLRSTPLAAAGWLMAVLVAGLVVLTGAWLTHAAGRLDGRAALMALTVTHQLGAAIWIGGLVQLGGLWRLTRRDPEIDAAWPGFVRRFSALATIAVVALVITAVPLTWTYTGSWRGLVGTGYGSLIVVKSLLLAIVLMLAAFNRRAARAVSGHGQAFRGYLPRLAEAEAILLVVVLFTAASLSAQPPAVDQPLADQATVGEVVEVFRPKVPNLHAPSLEAMRRSRAEMDAGAERTREAYLWSNFSHNAAGLVLLGTSVFALVALATRTGWERHWPLGFVALAVLVFLRAAANEDAWPFGPTPIWRIPAEGLQHWLAALLVLVLGLLEWRVRARPRAGSPLPYLLPTLAVAGGVLLLTHSHTAFQTKASFLVQVTHSTMGGLAAVLAAARWLELRLVPPASRWAGAASSLAMLAIALVLVFYREANLVFPP